MPKAAKRNVVRRLYDWVLHWAHTPYGTIALFLLAFSESSFFPVPPDVLLIALCVGNHRKWAKFALTCSIASVIGGAFGYLIGRLAMDAIGIPILNFVAQIAHFESGLALRDLAHEWFNKPAEIGPLHFTWGAWAVGIAGFTPIPYKVFTIAAGFFRMPFWVFFIASTVSRSARFFLVAGAIGLLFEKFGTRIETFIDKHFNRLSVAFVLLLLAGFYFLSLLKGKHAPSQGAKMLLSGAPYQYTLFQSNRPFAAEEFTWTDLDSGQRRLTGNYRRAFGPILETSTIDLKIDERGSLRSCHYTQESRYVASKQVLEATVTAQDGRARIEILDSGAGWIEKEVETDPEGPLYIVHKNHLALLAHIIQHERPDQQSFASLPVLDLVEGIRELAFERQEEKDPGPASLRVRLDSTEIGIVELDSKGRLVRYQDTATGKTAKFSRKDD